MTLKNSAVAIAVACTAICGLTSLSANSTEVTINPYFPSSPDIFYLKTEILL